MRMKKSDIMYYTGVIVVSILLGGTSTQTVESALFVICLIGSLGTAILIMEFWFLIRQNEEKETPKDEDNEQP